MGDFVKAVFGGKTDKSRPVDTTPEELKALRQPFVSSLTSLLQGGGRPAYEGDLVAGITPTETQNLQFMNQTAQDPARQALLQKTLSGYFLPGQEGSNPFLQSAIQAAQRPTQQALNDTLSRNLPGVFTQAGQQIGGGLRSPNANLKPSSTAFDTAAARAFGSGADALGDIATKMSFQGYESERGRQNQAVQLQQQDIQALAENLKNQGLPRLIDQMGLDKGLAEFNARFTSFLQALQIAAGSPIATQGQKADSSAYSGIIPGLFPKGAGGGGAGGAQ